MDNTNILQSFWKRIKRTYNPRWSILELAKGDIRSSLHRSFSIYSQRFIHTIKRCDGLHTVLWIRNTDLKKWREMRGIPAIRQCIGEVLAEEDGRRIFPNIYKKADEIKEQRKQAARVKRGRKAAEKQGKQENDFLKKSSCIRFGDVL